MSKNPFFNKLLQAGHLLVINPSLFFKYLKCHLKYLLPKRFLCGKEKNINGVIFSLIFDYPIDETYLKQICLDCYEVSLGETMKKFLKPGDIFIDVGANIGNLTALGAGLVGKDGEVYSFEPIPLYFQKLRELTEKNPGYKIIINNCALGEKTGVSKIDFTKPPHIGGSSMASGVLPSSIPRNTIEVPVMRLDDYIERKKIKKDKISLIKIDVEGFEFPVLKGLKNYFETTQYRPVIICEITPSAYPALGGSRFQLIEYMKRYGYWAYNIMNPKLKVDITKFKEGTNMVFKTSKQ